MTTTNCQHCAAPIELDDGTTWYHADSMQTRCDGPDDEDGLAWGDFIRTAEPPVENAWPRYDDYPFEDWQYEVGNGDTRLGYEEWVVHQRDAERCDRERTIEEQA